jgi:hypothetical protein
MIFNKDVLFIHIGKTGGTSVREYLKKVLKKPLYVAVSKDGLPLNNLSLKEKAKHFLRREHYFYGNPHATLEEAQPIVLKYGFSVSSFKRIIAVVRNPYEIELSLYHHLRKPHVIDRVCKAGRPEGKVRIEAASGSFDEFVAKNIYHRIGVKYEDYVMLNGNLPPNLRLIKIESLDKEMHELAKEFGRSVIPMPFPHHNRSERKIFVEDISVFSRKVIELKYKWIFDMGYYDFMQ